jgi:hypothetical protein
MACRKLAQQRVLRIMQQQSAEQAARMAGSGLPKAKDVGRMLNRAGRVRKSAIFDLVQNETLIPPEP